MRQPAYHCRLRINEHLVLGKRGFSDAQLLGNLLRGLGPATDTEEDPRLRLVHGCNYLKGDTDGQQLLIREEARAELLRSERVRIRRDQESPWSDKVRDDQLIAALRKKRVGLVQVPFRGMQAAVEHLDVEVGLGCDHRRDDGPVAAREAVFVNKW